MRQSLKMLLVFTVLIGLIYPFIVTVLSRVIFPNQARGSLIFKDGQVVGSRLIGQKFSSEKYFWSRPSASDYQGMPSAASNLSPISLALKTKIAERRGLVALENPSEDRLTASASGLDPHLSPQGIAQQISRVAAARSLTPEGIEILKNIIDDHIEDQTFGFMGQERVNVLELNLAIDSQKF